MCCSNRRLNCLQISFSLGVAPFPFRADGGCEQLAGLSENALIPGDDDDAWQKCHASWGIAGNGRLGESLWMAMEEAHHRHHVRLAAQMLIACYFWARFVYVRPVAFAIPCGGVALLDLIYIWHKSSQDEVLNCVGWEGHIGCGHITVGI